MMSLDRKIDTVAKKSLKRKFDRQLDLRGAAAEGREEYYEALFRDCTHVGDAHLYFMMDSGDLKRGATMKRGPYR